MFLAAAVDRRRSPRHITDILDNMTELYTAAGGIFLGAEYANRDGQQRTADINQPCLCVYGITTPLHFWNALQGSNVVGRIARPLHDSAAPRTTIRRRTPTRAFACRRHDLLAEAAPIAAGGGSQAAGNLIGMTAGPETCGSIPLTVPMERVRRRHSAHLRRRDHDTTCRERARYGSDRAPFSPGSGEYRRRSR